MCSYSNPLTGWFFPLHRTTTLIKTVILNLQAIHEMTHALAGGELGGPEEITDSFFARFDLDRDGQISFEEFRYGVLNDPLVIHLLECDPHPDR